MRSLGFIYFTLFFAATLLAQKKFSDSVLANPLPYAESFEKLFKTVEKPSVDRKNLKTAAVLENGYAQSKIKNPAAWTAIKNKNVPLQVEVVYTKYPKDKEFWLTNYHQLLANRLKELFALDERLNRKDVKFVIVLQTGCEIEEAARSMFHGFVIRYRAKTKEELKKEPKTKKDEVVNDSVPGEPSGYSTIKRFIKNCGGMYDSMVYKVLDRHKTEWHDLAIVCDWTTSNYQYAAQSVLWHLEHLDESNIKTFTFFNDGDAKYEYDKVIGKTGGLYYADASKTSKVVQAFTNSMRKGLGGEIPENDVEALLRTLEKFPATKSIALIADNSPFRDFELIDSVTLPVRVILQGTEYGINPQYINIAYRTKGSMHTLKNDYSYDFFAKKDSLITVEGQTFVYDATLDIYTCTNLLKCETLQQKIAQREEDLYNELTTKKAYRGMHKDKKASGINTFIHWLFGK